MKLVGDYSLPSRFSSQLSLCPYLAFRFPVSECQVLRWSDTIESKRIRVFGFQKPPWLCKHFDRFYMAKPAKLSKCIQSYGGFWNPKTLYHLHNTAAGSHDYERNPLSFFLPTTLLKWIRIRLKQKGLKSLQTNSYLVGFFVILCRCVCAWLNEK
jgi:hypothetical protein